MFAMYVRQHFPWNIVTYSYLAATYLRNSSSKEKEFNKNILSCTHFLIVSSFVPPQVFFLDRAFCKVSTGNTFGSKARSNVGTPDVL